MRKAAKKKNLLMTRRIAAVAALLLIVAGAVYLVGIRPFDRINSKSVNDPTGLAKRGVSLNPPTAQEKKDTETQKDKIIQQNPANTSSSPTATPSSSTKKHVAPLITEADQTIVRAYVPEIIEDGGMCTATFTRGNLIITKTSNGLANSTVTNCKPIDFSDAQFPEKGKWSLTVSYGSSSAEGKSAPTQVEIN